jgi:hypothetical protein
MISHPLFTIKENENISIGPVLEISEYFECELSAAELVWLEKKHISKALTSASGMTDVLKIYNQSADNIPDYDLMNAMLLFKKLNTKIKTLKAQQTDLEQRLKKYTNGENHKRYYEKNKDKIKETGASYLQKLKTENPEKIKEYSHRAYLNQKEKKLKKIAEEAEANIHTL